MKPIRSIVLLLLNAFVLHTGLAAQFTTAVSDGVIGAGEYGVHTNGQNQLFEGGTTWYMCWDANNLYVAFSGSNFNEAAVLYLDRNPIIPVNGGTDANGSLQGYYTYDRDHMMQPFRADFALYYKNGYHEFRHADGAGYWGGATSNTLAVGTGGGNTVEITIPWNTLTQGAGRPAEFNWFTYKSYDYGPGTNGVYHSVPVGNPNCACNQDPSRLHPTRYFNILNTGNGSSTKPFSTTSFTYYEDNSTPGTGGYYLPTSTFYDLTINDNSANNNDNLPVNRMNDNLDIANRVLVEGNITITHNLYVGQGSALLPYNNAGIVTADLIFTGSNGNLYNFGRIDANPEADNAGDWNNRRLNFQFTGTTRLQPTTLFKDSYRLSNVTIPVGGTLLGPSASDCSIELQWGTFSNSGTLNLGDGLGGYCDLGTRGDWTQHNDYFFSGGGTWLVHGILIGRNSSRLQPAGTSAVNLRVQGDFENFDEFSGKAGSGLINVIMAGKKSQRIIGNTTETTAATTTFHNLEIDNADLAGAWNNLADVWFDSYGGGTINYFITGALTLRNGDLITRHRTTNVVHNLTLRDSATTVLPFIHSNLSTLGSSFVDGPLRYEIENAGLVNRDFPIGKTKTEFGYAIGDARPIRLSLDHDATTRTTYTSEMFLDDRVATYTWPSPIPEPITWISHQRYWNVTKSAGANVQSAMITLSYDLKERNDGVTNPPALRIVKDDGAGNWVNIAVGGGMTGGGTGVGTGVITSLPFTTFSDFTLASIDMDMPLPIEMLEFTARPAQNHVQLEWKTRLESNASHFVVERSHDHRSFQAIGQVAASGNSQVNREYQFIDEGLIPDIDHYYYRLRLVDVDGSYSYSEVRAVRFSDSKALAMSMWPNPAHNTLKITLNIPPVSRTGLIQMRDLRGVLVLSQDLDLHDSLHMVDIEALPPGTYFVELQAEGQRLSEILVIQ